MAQRKQYSREFKAKVGLQALKGQHTLNEIASKYGVHPVQVAQWKKQALDELPHVFADPPCANDGEREGRWKLV